jgi:Xaa-Pro aminopeptidase
MDNKNIHAERLAALREKMREHGIDAYMIPTADFHCSEYVAPCFKAREYFSGFTGSAGILIVMQERADLWADGRYFIQAAKEIEGSGITLERIGEPGVPTREQFLKDHLKEGQTFGCDGRCITKAEGAHLARVLGQRGIRMDTSLDLPGMVWADRPALPSHPIWLLPEAFAGESAESKLARLRAVMDEQDTSCYVSSKLDEIMWLLNIRGNDVEANPVALSYLLVTKDAWYLFVQKSECTKEFLDYAAKIHLTVGEYEKFFDFAEDFAFPGNVLLDPNFLSFQVYQTIRENLERAGKRAEDCVVEVNSPLDYMKAIRNKTEIANFKDIYIEDSAVLTKFIYWLKKNVGKIPMTEGSAAKYLDNLRAQIRDYIELSFGTISAYGPNAAMMHYEPGEDGGAELKPEGMLLVDSGGHYMRGTTDVTRTMSLGPVTEDMRRSYSLTANSNFQLQDVTFLKGSCGMTLDICAREPMWENLMDYKCGTGHGVGNILNVHEGPQSIRYHQRDAADLTPFAPGMTISDEPGVYKAGQYGIRIENILLCVERGTTSDGTFYGFAPLTFAPLDRELLDVNVLTPKVRELINTYHAQVLEKIGPFMNEEELAWLKAECAAL